MTRNIVIAISIAIIIALASAFFAPSFHESMDETDNARKAESVYSVECAKKGQRKC